MPRVVHAYEHQPLRVGPGANDLTAGAFDELVRWNDRQDRRYFSVGHRSITFDGHVGYLEVGAQAIEVLPKLAVDGDVPRATWRAALLAMLRVATDLRLDTLTPASQASRQPTLFELIAERFLTEVEHLVHQGLAKGYRAIEENGPTFRGKLLVTQHVRANAARADRLYVEHTVFDHDTPVNQLVGMAVAALADRALPVALSARAGVLASRFPDTSRVRSPARLFARLEGRLTRATARYRDALVFARMILEHRAPELNAGHDRVFAILFDMNVLWEHWVTWLFRKACPDGARVSAQDRRSFWEPDGGPSRTIRPDIVVRHGDTPVLIADAKWKRATRPADEDLRQMFVYNQRFETRRALLVYPHSAGVSEARGGFTAHHHGCEVIALPLFAGAAWNRAGMQARIAGAMHDVDRLARPPAPG